MSNAVKLAKAGKFLAELGICTQFKERYIY